MKEMFLFIILVCLTFLTITALVQTEENKKQICLLHGGTPINTGTFFSIWGCKELK